MSPFVLRVTPIRFPRRVAGSAVTPFAAKVTSFVCRSDWSKVARITGWSLAPIMVTTGVIATLITCAAAPLPRSAVTASGPAGTDTVFTVTPTRSYWFQTDARCVTVL